jgi:hypothetical protein
LNVEIRHLRFIIQNYKKKKETTCLYLKFWGSCSDYTKSYTILEERDPEANIKFIYLFNRNWEIKVVGTTITFKQKNTKIINKFTWLEAETEQAGQPVEPSSQQENDPSQ